MLTFEWIWLLVLLPLPLLYRWWRPATNSRTPALKTPLYVAFAMQAGNTEKNSHRWRITRLCLLSILWVTAVIAAAGPQWLGEPVTLPSNGRDLLMAVDISPSMDEEDMLVNDRYINRLQAVKAVVGEFVTRRKGDRLGLILFGSKPYLQAPLTFDRHTVNTLLKEARLGFAGNSTAIGDAIGLAVKRLQDRTENDRVLILLSDGANSSGTADPIEAADIAAKKGIRIYTIGIGADEITERSWFSSRRRNPSRDLDEKTLTTIAEKTGGQYFRARDPAQLMNIYHQLDQLEPVEQEEETYRPTQSLFHWPLAAAFLASLILAAVVMLRGEE